MSETLKRTWPLLLLLEKVSPKLRNTLLAELADNPEVCYALREVFHNFLQGNIKVPKEQAVKLKRHMKTCQQISRMKKDLKTSAKRKKALLQVGGFLPILIKAAIPLITSLLLSHGGSKTNDDGSK